ncbi:MAG TPA: WD40 repeat domain-containing protein, partial [bacterium]|nr:WD40 repeat domain-containing protein [bacterium]
VWYKPDVVFSPDGKTILATGWDGSVAFYDFHGKRKGRPLFLEGIGAHAAFSPDGKWILASVIYGGSVGLARVWNVETHLARKFFLRDPGQILALDFNSDGTEILTGSADHTARIWDSQTGKPLGDAYWHGDSVTMGLFGPQDGTFFTASKDGLARLWNISDVREGQVRLDWKAAGREYSRKVQNHALFSPDGQRIATYSGKTVYLWNGSTGAGLGPPLAASGTILRVVFSPDSATLLTCDSDNQSRLWDLKTGGFKALPQEGPVRGGFFSADGKTLLTGSEDGTLRVWDLRAGKAWGSPLSTGMMVMRTFLSPDGERIAAMGKGGALRLYPLRKESPKALVKIDKGIRNAAFSSDGRYLIAAGSSSVTLFDTSNGKPLRKFEGGQGLQSLFPGPDGKTLATFGSDGTGRIWNLATGDSVGNSLKHAGPLQGAFFSPKGEILFATYQDGTGQFWDTRTAEPIGTSRPLGSLALDSVFGEGGQGLAVVLRDGRVLNLDTSWLSPSMNADSLLTSTEVAGLCRVDSHGSVEPLKIEEWLKLWRRTQEAKK